MQNVNFFKKHGGRWFSQRTTHYLKAGESKAGKSDLEVTYVEAHADDVVQLCSAVNCSAENSLGGLRIFQKSTILGGQTREQSTLLIAIATDEHSGQLVRQVNGQTPSQLSQYHLENDILTVTTETEGLRSEERWWFITDKLRMRTNVLSDDAGQVMASFCSEIRMGDVNA